MRRVVIENAISLQKGVKLIREIKGFFKRCH